ncbi:MAG: 3-deoxy-manno-octulosonate cytidylyltransferase [Candidatus Rhabdochlamydia sp.]
MTKIACIIPARLQSTRFPRKILAPLQGKPLLEWVWNAAKKVDLFHSVTIAVDSEETIEVVKQFGGNYLMTSPHCPNGTLRLCSLLELYPLEGDIFVCWQGDEPFLEQPMIEDLLQTAGVDGSDIWTLKKKITPLEASSPHHVKVVTDHEGYALYFSRSQIPFHRDVLPSEYDQHIGIYAYTRKALEQIRHLPMSALAEKEQLEMLNFMYHGLKIKVHETHHESFGIDIPEHLEIAHQKLAALKNS